MIPLENGTDFYDFRLNLRLQQKDIKNDLMIKIFIFNRRKILYIVHDLNVFIIRYSLCDQVFHFFLQCSVIWNIFSAFMQIH